MGQITELKAKTRQPAMVKPNSGGMVEKVVVVGTGIAIMTTFASTLPIAAGAAAIMVTAYFWDEIGKARNKDTSEELEAILTASTPRHPSINEVRSELKRLYPVAAINRAIESMLGHTGWVEFGAKDSHPLAPFGRVYCWINPEDPKEVMLPIQRLEALFTAWELLPTVEATASSASPHQGEELASNPPAIALPQGTQGSYQSPAAKELLARLRSEAPELLLLVKSPPIRLVGLQRTGKSTFAQRLTLLRMVLLPGHSAAWATPHRELDNPVPSVLNPVGYTATGAKDYASIEALWAGTQDRIDQGERLNQTAVWDEFGGYDQFSDPELLRGSLRSLLREATKFGYYPIIIAHGDQASFYPGIPGILTTVKQSTIKVETIGAPADEFGTMRPTGKAVITWLDGSTTELTWPAWLTTDYLLGCLQEPPGPPPGAPLAVVPMVATMANPDSHNGLEKPEEEQVKTDSQDTARVREKILAKLESSGNELVSLRDLTALLFNQTSDREAARQVVYALVNEQVIETDERLNHNKTVSYFFRLKKAASPTNEPPPAGLL